LLPIGCDYADRIAVAPDGTVYLAGSEGSGTLAAGRVWSSTDGGITWSTIAQFPMGGQGARDIQVDGAGNVFITTSKIVATSKSSTRHLVTYRGVPDSSSTVGINWTVVDDYLAPGQQSFIPFTLTLRPAGSAQPAQIWVGGYSSDGRTYSPLVRRSLDGGGTWVTVSTWATPNGYDFSNGWKVTAAADVNGIAYAAANYSKKVGKTTESHCLTYRSLNGGISWTLVDDFAAPSSAPTGAAGDALGGIFISGNGITRASINGGLSWVNASVAGGTQVATDSVGDVFVGGSTTEGVVYRLPAP
jgi:hypothetical protein